MTFEKLLGYTAAELKAMPAEEWQKMMEPYLAITRPDRAARIDTKGKSTVQKAKVNAANEMLAGLGLDFKL